MRSFSFTLAVVCVLYSYCFADDQSHPYFPPAHSVHPSLAAGSPKWFRPAYGYVLPASLIAERTLVPYLSQQADTPFNPYVFRQIKQAERSKTFFHRAGRVWPVPGDAAGFRVDVLWGYGNLPSDVGFSR